MTIAVVQSKQNKVTQQGSSFTLTVTLDNPTTAGNCIVVAVQTYGGASNPSISNCKLGGVADNFASLFSVNNASVSRLSFWADPNCAGSQTAVAIAVGGAQAASASVYEVSGIVTSSPLDKTQSNVSTSNVTTWTSNATATLSQADEIAIGLTCATNVTITGPSSPWTNLTTQTDALNNKEMSGYKVVAATTAVTFNGTQGSSSFIAGVVTLKAAASSVTGTGSVSMHKMGLSAAGTEKISGTGSVSMHKMGLSAAGTEKISGTGSVSMHKMGLSAAGTEKISGTGSSARHKMGLSGVGIEKLTLTNSYEGGSQGTTISPANSGTSPDRAFDAVDIFGAGATFTYDNAHPAHGAYGGKAHYPAGVTSFTYASWTTSIGEASKVWFRRYLYHTAYPSSNTRIWQAETNTDLAGAVYLLSDGSIGWVDAVGGFALISSPSLVPNNAKYRVEGYIIGSATVGQVGLKVFISSPDAALGNEDYSNESAADLNTTGTLVHYRFGDYAGTNQGSDWDLWFDDEGLSNIDYVGPAVPIDTGTGSVSMHKMGLSAAGTEKISGTGSVSMHKMGLSGASAKLLVNTAEGGSSGTTVTNGNSGGSSHNAFDVVLVSGNGGSFTFDNAHASHGSLSIKSVQGSPAGNNLLEWTTSLTGSALTQVWFRAYVYITGNPSQTIRWIRILSTGTFRAGIGLNASSKIVCIDSAGTVQGTSAAALSFNQWVRLEGFFIGSATVGQMEVKIFTTPDSVTPAETITTASNLNTGGNFNRVDFGNPAVAASYTHWMDDFAVSTTAYVGPAGVSGTGSSAMHKMGLSGASTEKISGTGSVSMHKISLSATGTEKISGTGSVSMHKMGLSGASTEKISGTGSVSMHKMGLSGASTEKISGTGSVSMHKMGLSATGTEKISGTGSVSMHKMGLSVAGTEKISGTGSVSMHKMGLSAAGTEKISGTGSAHMHKMGLSGVGTGTEKISGTGSAHMHKMGLHGVGTAKDIGTGSAHMHKMSLSAEGYQQETAGGSVDMHKMSLSAVGLVDSKPSALFVFAPV